MAIFDKLFKKKQAEEEAPFNPDEFFNMPDMAAPQKMPQQGNIDRAFQSGVEEAQSFPEPKVTMSRPGEDNEPGGPSIRPRLEPTRLEQMQQPPSRDAEIIISKLDAIKANIESINLRLENIERSAKEKEKRAW